MKRTYRKPSLMAETFMPQDFFAVCAPDEWAATCDKSGIIFFDRNGNGTFDVDDPVENLSYDLDYHGHCLKTHRFYSATKPAFNGFIIRSGYKNRLNEVCDKDASGAHYIIKSEYAYIAEPALIREKGEVFDHNWLVTQNLEGLKNVS